MKQSDWIREGEGRLADGKLCLCAFWGGWDQAYTYALGTWNAEHSGFTYPLGTMPEGQLMYWAFIETPPMPEHTTVDIEELDCWPSQDWFDGSIGAIKVARDLHRWEIEYLVMQLAEAKAQLVKLQEGQKEQGKQDDD